MLARITTLVLLIFTVAKSYADLIITPRPAYEAIYSTKGATLITLSIVGVGLIILLIVFFIRRK
ncbi:Uncharacterised protein [Legionella beliardensis]|uniref:Uncharacterized protein n=1 Tax=Legionella beliardensis TaxID=91822 RepID=A0A378HZ46_9GAMM|nr:hypothetical protein [Legionella beliardensis]STX28187.1 Uncharacterised protein [Legionella beliardensis]